MTPRNREVLHEIVEAYIATGEPVASRAIARRWHDGLSAASIRNAMADLAEEGFLSQPHTSAGRVPTEQAFRSYVESLSLRKLASVEIERLRSELGMFDTVEARIEHTSRRLTEMTSSVGIAAAIPQSSPALEQVELVGLTAGRVLMVVVTRDQQVRNRVVSLEEAISSDELISIRNYINRNFAGWTIENVRREMASRLEHAAATYDALLKKLTLLYAKGLLDFGPEPEVHMEGASNLFVVDLRLTKEKMRELFRALEEKKRVLELLDRFLEQPSGAIGVHVGLAEIHPSMGQLSLIGVPVILPNGMSAVIAVLGPMRMNYGRVISAVKHVGAAFQNA
ncbi:MAG: heat-inducible transcription repressor HrcA [Bryobacterales bacterium]|nr:heat-inducible transcription repressor HrcA [Bryobacterales bacterium]MBV9396725.1 heat-inducible transcription repressor HrcA [Bryobacterales bacterium]